MNYQINSDPTSSSYKTISPAPMSLLPGVITVIDGLVVLGLANSNWFSVPGAPGGGDRTITFTPSADGTVATFTALLESSCDGGVTWSAYAHGSALTFDGLIQVQVLHIVGGLLYRLNPQSLSFGTATGVSVTAALS